MGIFKQKESASVQQMKKLEQMAVEDQKSIAAYAQTSQEKISYQYNSKKSMVRNYRDLMIYRTLQTDEAESYGKLQKAADYVVAHKNRLGEMKMPQTEEGDAFSVDQIVLHLCGSSVMQDSVTAEDLRTLTDHLTAGSYMQGKNPNADICKTLQDNGIKALQEVYFRQLEGLSRKYGEKTMMKLSPAAYLKAYPQIEQDFACIEDMKNFFGLYHEKITDTPELKRMMQLLTYFSLSWKAVKARQTAFENGDLDGRAESDFREQMDTTYQAAKEQKLFEKRKPRVKTELASFWQIRKQQQAAAMMARAAYNARMKKEEVEGIQAAEKAKPLQQKYQAYKQYQEDLTALAELLEKQELDEKQTEYKKFLEDEIEKYEKSADFLTGEKAAELFKEYNRILDDANPYKMEEITSSNALAFGENIFHEIEELCNTLSTCSDQELLKQYTELHYKKKILSARLDYLSNSGIFSEASDAAKAAGVNLKNPTPEAMEKFRKENPWGYDLKMLQGSVANISKDWPLFQNAENILEARLAMIEKYGYTNGSSLTEQRDITNGLFGFREKYTEAESKQEETPQEAKKSRISAPPSLQSALTCEFGKNQFANLENIDLDTIFKEIAACRKVQEFRKSQPNFYHLGLTYKKHAKAEAMCELLPFYESALELTLQYLGMKAHENVSFEKLKDDWEEALKSYDQKQYNAFKADTMAEYKPVNRNEAKQNKINALLEEDKKDGIFPEQAEERLKFTVIDQGIDFITDFSKDMKKKDIALLYEAASYMDKIANGQDYAVSKEQFDGIAVVAQQFVSDSIQLEEILHEKDYADYTFYEQREKLLKCQRQTYFLENIFQDEAAITALMDYLDHIENQEGLELQKEWFRTMPERIERMRALGDYAAALELEYAKANGVKEMMVWDGGYASIAGTWMQKVAATKRMKSRPVIDRLRAAKGKEDHREEIRKQQMEARVRHALGREIIASEAKTFAANLKQAEDMQSLAGNLIGAPLQFFSWIMHEKRTADHGIVRYDECVTKHKAMHSILGEGHAMQEACLPAWQRGSGYAPVIDLDALFSSPMKKRIYTAIHSAETESLRQSIPTDIMNKEFLQAIDAISRYATVVGIVNTDTTEMEMAFLDMFQKKTREYLESSIASKDETIVQRCNLLLKLQQELWENLNGTMADTMSKEELDKINEGTVAYVENTIFSQNMEESNIQDIPLFLHEPNINDVRQSSIGNCWLVSAISALVKASPDFIKSMFHDAGDGNVIVRLYGTERNGERITSNRDELNDKNVKIFPIYVKLRKHYETGWGNASDCTWVQLLEKAYALSGLNMRNEMRVEGNQMYNVTDELTYGIHSLALLHMTGHYPEEIRKVPLILNDVDFYNTEFIASLLDGFPADRIPILCHNLFSGGGDTSKHVSNTTGELLEIFQAFYGDIMTEDEVEQKLNQNIQNMKKGVHSATFSDTQKVVANCRSEYKSSLGLSREFETDSEQNEAMAHYASYFEKKRNPNYTANENYFYQRCKEAFESGSALSVAIPHCVDLLDAKEENTKLFILMRDPFNVYNNEYTLKTGQPLETKEERFKQVLTDHKENRHLMGNGDDFIRYGFRGTSWIELKDIYKMVYAIYKAPVNLKVNYLSE